MALHLHGINYCINGLLLTIAVHIIANNSGSIKAVNKRTSITSEIV